jgi:hypothetical protein
MLTSRALAPCSAEDDDADATLGNGVHSSAAPSSPRFVPFDALQPAPMHDGLIASDEPARRVAALC